MELIEKYLQYISLQKRYSKRTQELYASALKDFASFYDGENLLDMLSLQSVRAYQIHILDDLAYNPRTANLHLSVISGLCRYLVHQGLLKSNPVSLLKRPKEPKRLPVFYKDDAMAHYLEQDNALSRRDFDLDLQTEAERKDTYWLCLRRAIVCLLYSSGMRRAELIGLRNCDVDFSRSCVHVLGKGDKMREIPLVASCIQEISLYLQAREKLLKGAADSAPAQPFFLTYAGAKLYPVLVDRAVKAELGSVDDRGFDGRKSPHVLRHSLATGLLEHGADLNSIKEVLGHANLAATQVYTHSNPAQLKRIYDAAHPRSKKK